MTVNRLSLFQLHCEERKHRAHLRKISEMQCRSGLDNSTSAHFLHVHNHVSYNICQESFAAGDGHAGDGCSKTLALST